MAIINFNKVKATAFDELITGAGVLLSSFDISSPAISDANIISATTGGLNVSAVPAYSDWGEDVDNCPNNTKEMVHTDGWNCSISTTVLGFTEATIKLALGAYTQTATGAAIKPTTVDSTHFSDLWWVGNKGDDGIVAIKLIDALSTGGFALQTTKNGKGQLSITLTGHVSINSPENYPMEFYVAAQTA